ncbi:MAG: hypothetical protein ABI150_14655 [Nitrobacter sp.]
MAAQILQGLDGKLKPDQEWQTEVTDEFLSRLFAIFIHAED